MSTIAQVAAALRTDRTLFGRTWPTVIGVGHSLGSGTLVGVVATDPADLAALVLTGYGAAVTPQTLQLDQRYQVPARTVSPRWSALDPGYVTVVPSAVEQIGLLYPPGTSAADLAATAAHQGTLSTTELATRPQGAAAVTQGARVTVPVLVADGQYDRHYCEANPVGAAPTSTPQCRGAAAFQAYAQALLPHACLATSLIADSGHAIQEESAAPAANARYLSWLRTTVTNGHARCATTGPPAAPTS